MSDLVQRAVEKLQERIGEAEESKATAIGIADDFLPAVLALMEATDEITTNARPEHFARLREAQERLVRAILGEQDG